MTTPGAVLSRAPQARVRSHRFAAPTLHDITTALHRADDADPAEAWAAACAVSGLDPLAPALDLDELAAVTVALAGLPGPAGLVGRAMRIRIATYQALAADDTRRPGPPWDWARETADQLLRDRIPTARRTAELLRLAPFNPAIRRSMDRAAATAAHQLDAPIGMINIVLEGAVEVVGSWGLEGWVDAVGGMPVEWAFCSRMVRAQEPYVLPDTKADVLHRHNPLVVQDGAAAYAGAAMVSSQGAALGACCVVSGEAREFTASQLTALEEVAAWAVREIEAEGRSARRH